MIYLSISEINSSLTMNLLLSLWNDLLTKEIPKNQLSLAKLKLRSSFLHSYRTCEEITFRKVRLLSLDMDPFYDEKVKEYLKEVTSEQVLTVSKKYLSFPCISILGSKKVCNNLKKIWKNKF